VSYSKNRHGKRAEDKLFRAIGGIGDDLIEAGTPILGAEPKEKTRRVVAVAPWLKWVVPMAACLAIAVAVALPRLFVPAPDTDGIVAGGGLDIGDKSPAAAQPSAKTPDSAPAPKIVINEFSAQYDSGISNLFNLSWDDFISLDRQGLNDFYGIDVFPSVVPADMALPSERNDWGIFKRNAGKDEIYWTQNGIVYSNAIGYTDEGAPIFPKGADGRSLSIGVAKEKLFPKVDFREYMEGTEEKSVINGNDVLIGHYISENGQYEYHYASFLYCNVDFLATGCNLSQAEFIDAVLSITALIRSR
jgi:hypothetical protein